MVLVWEVEKITIGIISNKCYGERKKEKYILEIVRYLKTRGKK